MPNTNEIKLTLTIDGKDALATINLTDKEINKLVSSIRQAGDESRNTGDKLVHSFAQARNLIQGLKETFYVLTGLFQKPVTIFIDYEQARVAFEVLIGNAEKADKLIKDLKQYAAKTPLEFTQLQDAAKILLNFNIAAEDIIPTLKMLGDISGGNADKLKSLTIAFAQIQSTGRLTGQDLLQLINAGFNPLQQISIKTGKSVSKLKEEMEKGSISAKMVKQAFIEATSVGGRFYGMLEKQSGKLGGKLSNLKDSIADMQRNTGELISKAFSPLIELFTQIISKINQLSPALSGLIGLITTLTIAFGTLNAIGITSFIKSIITGMIPAITALRTALASLQVSIGPVGWLTLGLSAIAGLWVSIAEGQEKDIKNSKNITNTTFYDERYKRFRLNIIKEELAKKDIDPLDKLTLERERNILLSELNIEPQDLPEQNSDINDEEEKLKKEFNLLKQRLDMKQEHEMNMLEIETNNKNILLALERKHLEERKKLYEKYGQDITQINYRLIENEYKSYKDLTDIKTRDFEKAEKMKINLREINIEELNKLEQEHAENIKKITNDVTEFEKWLFDEEANHKMRMQAQVLNFIASGYNQYTVMAKIATMFTIMLKAKEAYMQAFSAFPPPLSYIVAAAIAASTAAQISQVAKMKPPRFQEGGRLRKGQIGFIEGIHDEIIAPEKTFIELFKTELKPQIYAGINNNYNNNEILIELKNLNKKINEWPNELNFKIKGYDLVTAYEKNKGRIIKLKY